MTSIFLLFKINQLTIAFLKVEKKYFYFKEIFIFLI